MQYRYFEDFSVGESLETPGFLMTEADIIAYAKDFDPQPMHTDPAAAAEITGGLIAAGWHTARGTVVYHRPAVHDRARFGWSRDKRVKMAPAGASGRYAVAARRTHRGAAQRQPAGTWYRQHPPSHP